MIIYQMLLRLWGEGKFSSVDKATFEYLRQLGVSHIWYTGIPRHASGKDFVKGTAGSPYAISDYYDVNPYMADNEDDRLNELKSLISRTHAEGFKFLMDFVPNHVAKDYDPQSIPIYDWCDYDWTDTRKINYEAPLTWEKMRDIVRFWATMGVDGFRCDMVEMVPPEFMKWLISEVRKEYPGICFIAEVYRKEDYRKYVCDVDFDYLYDKSGLYDILRNIVSANLSDSWIEPWQSTKNITWNWQSLGDIQSHMLNFLENHDEQRFPSAEFGRSIDNEFAPLAVSAMFNRAPFMIYFGQEIGVDASESDNGRTSIFDFAKVESLSHLYGFVHSSEVLTDKEKEFFSKFGDLTRLASSKLKSEGMVYDLCYCNEGRRGFDMDRYFTFLRHFDKKTKLFFCNFSSSPAEADIMIPEHAFRLFGMDQESCIDRFETVSAGAFDYTVIDI